MPFNRNRSLESGWKKLNFFPFCTVKLAKEEEWITVRAKCYRSINIRMNEEPHRLYLIGVVCVQLCSRSRPLPPRYWLHVGDWMTWDRFVLCQRNSIIAASNLAHFHRLILSHQSPIVCFLRLYGVISLSKWGFQKVWK